MDKKYIYVGLGLLAVGGLAYYFMSGRSSGAKSMGGDFDTQGGTSDLGTATTDGVSSIDQTLGTFTSAGTRKKQIRVNCRVEAKNRGLRGRERRQFRKECRSSGGFDDGVEDFLGASGNSGFGCTTKNGMVGTFVNIPQGTSPETFVRTCVSRGFRDRA